jgi:TPR repeat protein
MTVEPISYWTLIRESAHSLGRKLSTRPEEAARWVRAAAHNGSKAAIVTWGEMLLDGHGVARDPAAAFRWFKIAADAGDPDGINMLGRCYELGLGVPSDPAQAAQWYGKAADLDHAWARFNLGCLLLNGGEPDRHAALSLFVRSARQGNAKSMNMIGRFREEGWTGPVRLAAAFRWYRRAAEGGCFRGQFHLARFLWAQGSAVEAEAWLRQSVANASPDFCRDMATMLGAHEDPRLREIARLAAERARPPSTPTSPTQAPPPPWPRALARSVVRAGRRTANRLRALLGRPRAPRRRDT